jgi:hypothetical protein
MADLVGEKLGVILNASQGCKSSTEGQLCWLEQRLVVASRPGAFKSSDELELAEVLSAWKLVGEKLPQRILLFMGSILGGHPGGGWTNYVCAHDLPGGGSIYTVEVDVADVGEQWTAVVALSETIDPEVDDRVVELALSVDDPRGLRLGYGALGGTLDDMSTTLPRDRAVPVLVEALTAIGDLVDVGMEELAAEAPGNLEPWGPEWKAWLVEEYFAPFLPDP